MPRWGEGDWGQTVAEAWRRLMPSTVAGGDPRGFGRVTLSRRCRDAHGEPGGSHAVLDTWPFVSTDTERDHLAARFGHEAGSEGAESVRRWAATVLEVWEAAREVWGSEGEKVSMSRVNAVVEVAHAACLAASAVAIGFGDWIEEEGRFAPDGGDSLWGGDAEGWTMVGQSPASGGVGTAGFPWRVRRSLTGVFGAHDLADAIVTANASIAERCRLLGDSPPKPGSIEWEEARALLETGAVRVAVADLMWGNRGKVRSGNVLGRFNKVDPRRVLALAEKALALRWGGRAASLLLARYDLPPLTALETETLIVPDLDPKTGEEILVAVEARLEPEGSSEEVAEAIFESAMHQAEASLAMAAFVIGNRDRRRQCVERILGLSADALAGEWSDVPAFAWRRGRGVNTRVVATLLSAAERAARSAKVAMAPDPRPEYSEAMAAAGEAAVKALLACGLIDPSEPAESSAWAIIDRRKKGDLWKARRLLSRAAGRRLKRVLSEASAEAVIRKASADAVARACDAQRIAMGEGRAKAARWNLPDWMGRCRDRDARWEAIDAVAEVSGMAGLRNLAEVAEKEAALLLLERGGEFAVHALGAALELGADPGRQMETLVAMAAQGSSSPKSGLFTSPVPPPDTWLLYGCAKVAIETAAPEKSAGPILGRSSPARWLVDALRSVAGQEIKEAETRHLLPVLKAIEEEMNQKVFDQIVAYAK